MTKEQCNKCLYSSRCDGVLHFKSSHLNMTCKQDRAKATPKPKPKAPKKAPVSPAAVVSTPTVTYVAGADPAVEKCTPPK